MTSTAFPISSRPYSITLGHFCFGHGSHMTGFLPGPRALHQFGEPCTGLSKWLARTVGATSNIGALNCRQQQAREGFRPPSILEREVSLYRLHILVERGGYDES